MNNRKKTCTRSPLSQVLAHAAFCFWLGVLLFGPTAQAAPFRNLHVPFVQPDGTRIEVIGWGDEFAAVFETVAGYTVVFDPGLRAYCYAALAADGQLVSSRVQVHLGNPAAMGLPQHLRMTQAARKQQVLERWQRWEAGMQVQKRWEQQKAAFRLYDSKVEAAKDGSGPEPGPPTFTTTGSRLGLCLLVDFDNDPATLPQAEVVNFCNGDAYNGYGNNGSVKKYYQDNSNGLLTYSNVVTIYIRIPNTLHPKSWYDDPTKDCGAQGNLLIRDALTVMRALPNYTTEILPTFTNLTVDAQNQVVACNVFYAGANSGVWSYGLWPHSWALFNVGAQALSPGGKKVWYYQISNLGSSLELGTFCHENGHMLCGFPDIYDYDYDALGGAGIFCLMGYGAVGEDCAINPVQVCAYLKRAAGWATTTALTGSSALVAALTATPGANFNHFYRYQKPGVATEYFLAEARYAVGRDACLPASGVALWHIDELGDRDNQSLEPNTRHRNYEVTLVQADNLWHFEQNANTGDSFDLYYAGNSTDGYSNEFSDGSTPNAQWWDGLPSGVSFREFALPGADMTFTVGYTSSPPLLTRQPQNRAVPAGYAVSFGVGVVGTAPLACQWYFGGLPISGATSNPYTLPSAQAANQGDYYVVVTNSLGTTNSQVATLTVLPPLTLANALDTSNLVWTTSGNGLWEGELDTTHDGVDAAVSGAIADNQVTMLTTSITNGPGTLRFWWKVSSETNYDFLQFYLDGVLQSRLSGEVNWQQQSAAITAGNHTLRWRYFKDSGVARGLDCGWLDQVSFEPALVRATLLTPRYLANGQFQFELAGTAGGTYVVQASTNLVDWVSLATNAAPFTFTDTNANMFSGRFYHARSGP